MRWSEAKRAALLAPVLALMCADSPMPGACSGKSPPPDRGTIGCTMRVAGADLACTGAWVHWKSAGDWQIEVRGETEALAGSIKLFATAKALPGTEIRVAPSAYALSAEAKTVQGTYRASGVEAASSAVFTVGKGGLPGGTFQGVLVPGGASPGPAGTTVTLFVGL